MFEEYFVECCSAFQCEAKWKMSPSSIIKFQQYSNICEILEQSIAFVYSSTLAIKTGVMASIMTKFSTITHQIECQNSRSVDIFPLSSSRSESKTFSAVLHLIYLWKLCNLTKYIHPQNIWKFPTLQLENRLLLLTLSGGRLVQREDWLGTISAGGGP